jgi:hypothetical protein
MLNSEFGMLKVEKKRRDGEKLGRWERKKLRR